MGVSAHVAVPVSTFISRVLSVIGAPYVWAGKGEWLVNRDGAIRAALDLGVPYVFDCSGLVTWALKHSGAPDLRGTHSAQVLWNAGESAAGMPVPGRARFYGKDKDNLSHVSVLLAHEPGFQPLIVDASGGDSTTRTLLDAQQHDAKVRVHWDRRRDFIGEKWLPWLVPSP